MSHPPIEYRMYLDHDVIICGRFLLCLYNGNQGLYGDYGPGVEDVAVLSICFAWLSESNEYIIPRSGISPTLISIFTSQEECELLLQRMMAEVLETDLDPTSSIEPYISTVIDRLSEYSNQPLRALPFDDDVSCLEFASGICRSIFSPLTSSFI